MQSLTLLVHPVYNRRISISTAYDDGVQYLHWSTVVSVWLELLPSSLFADLSSLPSVVLDSAWFDPVI